MSDYPEHDKLKSQQAEARAISAFIDMLQADGLRICSWSPAHREYFVTKRSNEDLVGVALGVDPVELSREKDRMAEAMQKEYEDWVSSGRPLQRFKA